MIGVIDYLFKRPKESAYVVAAKCLIQAANKALDTGMPLEFNAPPETWNPLFPNDPNSPTISFVSDDSKLIFYPKNSTPYHDIETTQVKDVFVLDGVIYDEANPENVFVTKDNFKIFPNQNLRPYTRNSEALVFVKLEK